MHTDFDTYKSKRRWSLLRGIDGTWLRITPVFRKRYGISFRFRQKRARNNAEITRNRALFSEITKNTANFDGTIYRTRTNTNPNDTEANAAGISVRACVARKSKS